MAEEEQKGGRKKHECVCVYVCVFVPEKGENLLLEKDGKLLTLSPKLHHE